MQPEASTSKSAIPTPNTVLAQLQSLLTSQSTLTAALPYLHPYAPARHRGKGKARVYGAQDQIEVLQRLKQSVQDARGVLHSATVKEEARVKLTRALKDVSNHQQSTIPSSTAISTLAPTSSTLPSKLIHLSPIELLKTLATKLEIQFYLEESQFGLLKTSLTLAGTCFVVDLDLETDAVAGNDEDDEMDVDARSEATGQDREGKGKVRLSKITGNHVRGEATGKSDWIAKALRDSLERYLAAWNERPKSWEGQMELEKVVRKLEGEMGDLKELDLVAEMTVKQDGQVDWFAELEDIAVRLALLVDQGLIFPSGRHNIYPTLALLPSSRYPQHLLRLRPTRRFESVPIPPGLSEDIEEPWLKAPWVLEHVNESSSTDGLVIRRSWLAESVTEGEINWDGLIRTEHLLYRQISDLPLTSGIALPFPYTSDFVHPVKGSLEQRWAVAEPGPEGFIFGRVGIPKSLSGFQRLVELLRAQVVLNRLFGSVFQPDKLDDRAGDDEEDNDDDLLSGPARATAITAKWGQRELRISLPVPTIDPSLDILSITLSPSPTAPFVEIAWKVSGEMDDETRGRIQRGVDAAKGAGVDAVEIVKRVIDACLE